MIIPLITIPVKANFTLNNSFDNLTITTGQFLQRGENIENAAPAFTFQNILTVLFILISVVLLLRFILNIFRIVSRIIKCKKIENLRISLVLIEEKILPYSFFSYIFVNRSDFENGKIEKELIIHEEAHCLQYHSIDIIILEIINVFLWFNPAIWFYRKAIHLNHEYYADNKVLTNSDIVDYHHLLVSLVIQNNTNNLVSNIKYSLIKNRLIMMTKSRPSHSAVLRKIAAISFFLFLGIVFTFSQVNKTNNDPSNLRLATLNQQDKTNNDWWRPIAKKHNISFKFYTIYENHVIFGEKTSKDGIEIFKSAIAIENNNKSYWIYNFKTATYDSKIKKLKINGCTMEKFDMNSEKTESLSSYKNINYSIDFNTHATTMADTLAY